ncbi:MAG: tetratricopeptide repeat protein [Agriterribacter sp.]
MVIPFTKLHSPVRYILTFTLLCGICNAYAQKQKADSLEKLLPMAVTDTTKVILMWQLADAVSMYQPDTALKTVQQALFLAKRIKYTEGESRSLGITAEIFRKIGNYPKALDFNLRKLKLEETRRNQYNLASVLMNIGIVYVFQEEYRQGLKYYFQADSVITNYNIEPFKYHIALNVGDAYYRLKMSDSAYIYFNKSLQIARQLGDGDFIGTSMTGLAHCYLGEDDYPFALLNYQTALKYLSAANDDDIFCEAALGLSKLYRKMNKMDSAIKYANISLYVAKKDGFLTHELDATELLVDYYKEARNIDSAFTYMQHVYRLNDAINSRDKIKEVQIISSNEQLRQAEREEEKRIALKERSQQLQLLFIGIFIPIFFALTIILSRIQMPIRVIKGLGIVSLLFFFEYLTLLLHPYVLEITHHTPVLEILIFVVIAAILIPAHHRMEHWLIGKLIDNRSKVHSRKLKLLKVPQENITGSE